VTDADTLLHVAELGVVLFLFVIGLEMRPSKLWKLRGEIFGLGTAQVLALTALLTGVAYAAGLPLAAAAIGAAGFVLSSTAVIMQMLDESGELGETAGQRAVSILLLEDLAIVPLLAIVAFWAATNGQAEPNAPPAWQSIAIGVGTIARHRWASGCWIRSSRCWRVLARARS
jgi:glutathione-regulated potassium-efflux system protein KefB